MEKKKWIELIGSIFVAVIFLSSYAAFSDKNPNQSTTTTISATSTFRATASGTARILGYGPIINITVRCPDASNVSNQVNDFLGAQNSSVEEIPPYSYDNMSQIIATAGRLGSYYLYNAISQDIGASANCTGFSSSADILLPATMTFKSEQQGSSALIQLPGMYRNSSQSIVFTRNMSNTMNVFVDAILTLNGSIYQGNIRVKGTA